MTKCPAPLNKTKDYNQNICLIIRIASLKSRLFCMIYFKSTLTLRGLIKNTDSTKQHPKQTLIEINIHLGYIIGRVGHAHAL